MLCARSAKHAGSSTFAQTSERMKFRVYMKDPDGVYESIADASDRDEQTRKNLSEFIKRWCMCGEYITIEFDTDAGTATVVEVK